MSRTENQSSYDRRNRPIVACPFDGVLDNTAKEYFFRQCIKKKGRCHQQRNSGDDRKREQWFDESDRKGHRKSNHGEQRKVDGRLTQTEMTKIEGGRHIKEVGA